MSLMKYLLIFLLFFATTTVHAQKIPKWKITDIESLMNRGDSVLVINFWATFCKPCVEEIPDFIRISKKYAKQKVRLQLVSIDLPSSYPAKITAFAKKSKFNTNIAWLNETNADYFCPKIATRWSGAIPATLIINPKTGYRKFFEDQLKPEEFEMELKLAIGDSKTYHDHSIDRTGKHQNK